MEILGVRIDNFSRKEILEKMELFLSGDEFHQVATVNPEFILQAQKDEEFARVLNQTSLNLADGVGLWYAFLRFGQWLRCRFAGTDLMHEILYLAYKHNYPVFLAVNKNGLSKFGEVKMALEKEYVDVNFEGADIDPQNIDQWSVSSDCKILLCNFGAPTQEVFINSVKNDKMRLAMGVGGSFDFACGKVKRAPKFLRDLGLEWFWRLTFQSWKDLKFLKKRWIRVWHAAVVFPIRIMLKK